MLCRGMRGRVCRLAQLEELIDLSLVVGLLLVNVMSEPLEAWHRQSAALCS